MATQSTAPIVILHACVKEPTATALKIQVTMHRAAALLLHALRHLPYVFQQDVILTALDRLEVHIPRGDGVGQDNLLCV